MPSLLEGIPSPLLREQLGVLVLDRSPSMTWEQQGRPKAEVVEEHIVRSDDGLIARLKESSVRSEFRLAMVTFSSDVTVDLGITNVLDMQSGDVSLRLLERSGQGDGTAIGDALKTAYDLACEWLSNAAPDLPRWSTICLMSDGESNRGADPDQVVAKIRCDPNASEPSERPRLVIATAAYGDKADKDLLRRLATTVQDEPDRFYREVQTGSDLRKFFLASIQSAPRP